MRLETINIDDIMVEDRAREDVGDLSSLKESLSSFVGQIHTVAVLRVEGGDKPYKLLAGGRRVAAMTELGMKEVGAKIYESLDQVQQKEVELIENVDRLDMDWKDRVKLEEEIHEMKTSIHGERSPGQREGWSYEDTARLIGKSEKQVRRDVKLSKAIDEHPQLAKCKSKKDAMNLLAAMQERLALEELARREKEEMQSMVEPTGGASDPLAVIRRRLKESYKHMDFFEGVKQLPAKSFDLAILDPPYGIDYKNFTRSTDTPSVRAMSEDFHQGLDEVDFPGFINNVLTELDRVLKDDAWVILWYAMEPWSEVNYQALISHGYKTSRIHGTWFKGVSGRASSNPEEVLGHTYEPFYYAKRGKAFIVKRARGDVFQFGIADKARFHPTEKPRDLIREILRTFITSGSNIISPFAGSGNDLLAAADLGIKAIGFDVGDSYYHEFLRRAGNWEPEIT